MRRSVRAVPAVVPWILPLLLAGPACTDATTGDPDSPMAGGSAEAGRGGGGGSGGSGGPGGPGGSTGGGGSNAGGGGGQGGSDEPGGAGAAGGGNAGGNSAGEGGDSGGAGGGAGGAGGETPDPEPPPADAGAAGSPGGPGDTSKFSFFVTSLKALQVLSGSENGFGGDLRFGKADGLAGADEICRQAAEMGKPGAGQKTWRAFLSVTEGPEGMPVHARDRIGPGPWYDRNERLVAMDLDGLFSGERPAGDPMIVSDLPNERGEPNHYVGPNGLASTVFDNHDTITGSDTQGRLRAGSAAATCNDWTSTTATGRPYCGHSWPRSPRSGRQWASDHQVANCRPGLDRTLGGSGSSIGTSGGYGGFYCFALPQ